MVDFNSKNYCSYDVNSYNILQLRGYDEYISCPSQSWENFNNLQSLQADMASFGGKTEVQDKKSQQKKSSTGKKILKDTCIIIAIATAVDFLFFKGQHVKNLIGKFKVNKTTKPDVKIKNPIVEADINPETISTEISSEFKPKAIPKEPKAKNEIDPKNIKEISTDVSSEARQETIPKEPKVKTDIAPKNKTEISTRTEQNVKKETPVKTNIEPKAEPEVNIEALKKQFDNELSTFAKNVPNMSRTELAKARYELSSWGSEICKLEKAAKEKGLSKAEKARLDYLKNKLSLIEQREKEIENSLRKFKPTVTENSAVPTHHEINGENSAYRRAIKSRAKNFEGMSEDKIQEVLSIEKNMAKLDKEFSKLPPTEKDYIVYRGRSENPLFAHYNKDFEIIGNSKIGDIITPDTGYSYTAFDRKLAEHWGGEGTRSMSPKADGKPCRIMMYEIHIPKGAKVSRNLEHGGEVVMPRGAQYKLIGKNVTQNGDIEVTLEYILPNL